MLKLRSCFGRQALALRRHFSFRIDGANCGAEMFANIRGHDGPHPKLVGCDVTGHAADVECRDDSLQRVSIFLQSSVGLRQKPRDYSSQGIAGAGGPESGIAGWVYEHGAIRRRDYRSRALQQDNHLTARGKLARGRDAIIERGFVIASQQPEPLSRVGSYDDWQLSRSAQIRRPWCQAVQS